MSNSLKCPSCGGFNNLPEGKMTMFCSFCGNPIESKIPKRSNPKLSAKPKITYSYEYDYRNQYQTDRVDYLSGVLALNSRDIESITEVTSFFSDNELDSIKELDLSNNNISDLKGLDSFSNLRYLNLSQNQLKSLNGLEDITFFSFMSQIDLSNNKFQTLSDDDIEVINNISIGGLYYSPVIDLKKNPFTNYDWVSKIDFNKILRTYLENGSATFLADASVEIKLNNETVKHYHPQRKAVLARQESEKKTEAVLRYLNPYLWLGIAIVIFVIYNLGPAVIKLLLNKH